jgi:hypothetical protein
MSQEPLNPDLAAVEKALASLAPRASTIDRDRLMFLAGQAVGTPPRTRWLWPLSTAASLLLAVSLVLLLVARPAQTVERIVYLPQGSPTEGVAVAQAVHEMEPMGDYLRLRRLMIDEGIDRLPEPSSARGAGSTHPASSPDQRALLRHLLNG